MFSSFENGLEKKEESTDHRGVARTEVSLKSWRVISETSAAGNAKGPCVSQLSLTLAEYRLLR